MRTSWKHSIRWSIFISIITFFLACIFSVISTTMLAQASLAVGFVIILLIIAVSILFDMMGLASASADEQPFHAMAAKRVLGSQQAIYIVRHADRFSNFCNDVIGDICGIISGTASALLVVQIMVASKSSASWVSATLTIIVSGTVSALMVGGKAIGKSIAIHQAVPIVLWVGKIFAIINQRMGVDLQRRKQKNVKRGNKRAARTNQPTE